MSIINFSVLHTIPGFSFKHYQQLLSMQVGVDDFLHKPHTYQHILNLSHESIAFIQAQKFTPYLKQLEAWLASSTEHHLIHLIDTSFPPQLKQISDPPLSLYAIGDISLLDTLQLAIVGTRQASLYGSECIKALIPNLLHAKLTINSGMALGIDTLAHQETLNHKGKTIAVLGTGVNICYPAQNRDLYTQIQTHGLVISEFLLGQAPKRFHFPKRNRLISGLSLGVVVIEAAHKSGSLITAMHALEQNRDVFAIPGNIFHTQSHGCHKLIQMGAKLVCSADDIIGELNLTKTPDAPQTPFQQSLLLTSEQQLVFDSIGSSCTTIDKIIDTTNLTYAKITGILFELEMEALISAVLGGYKRI